MARELPLRCFLFLLPNYTNILVFFLFAPVNGKPEVFLPKYSQTAILHAAHFRRVVKHGQYSRGPDGAVVEEEAVVEDGPVVEVVVEEELVGHVEADGRLDLLWGRLDPSETFYWGEEQHVGKYRTHLK